MFPIVTYYVSAIYERVHEIQTFVCEGKKTLEH